MTSKIYSPYFLVLWQNEDKYSVIHRLSISDGTLRSECDSKLPALDNLEMLFNRRIYIGKLVYAGRSQKEVNMHLKTLEEVPVGNLVSKCNVNIEKSNRNKRKANERVSDIDKVINQVSELEDRVSHSSSNSNVNSLPEFSVASTSVENSVEKDADEPSVDSLKRDAVINYCISTSNEDAKRSHSPFFKSVIRERIVKSLGEYIREVATKIANRGDNNDAADNDD
ncbi:unnamed protein product [Allacma fusca]|uniref:BEN domain-containing protein n=1 Tax=Allacma fusca TaxID=39272 RepID=A0A8J2LS56_9HEXA|nr:unnamed protein product [Allacma fusca]